MSHEMHLVVDCEYHSNFDFEDRQARLLTVGWTQRMTGHICNFR